MTASELNPTLPRTSASQTRWPCASFEADCAPQVLHAVCTEAVAAFRTLAKGGLEIGGILLGHRREGTVSVLAARPIQCEHKQGPSFVLSERDHTLLQQTLSSLKADPELDGLELLGLYLSHSRHGSVLTDLDVELFNRYFADTCRLALVLLPSALGSVRIHVLAPDAQGTHVPCHQCDYSVLGQAPLEVIRRRKPQSISPIIPSAGPVSVPPAGISSALPTAQAEHVSAAIAPRSTSAWTIPRFWKVPFASAIMLALSWQNAPLRASLDPLTLTERGQDLIVQWNLSRPTIPDGLTGAVDIRDGQTEPVRFVLDADVLRRGWFPYRRKSDLVRISLTLNGQGVNASESAIYFAPQRPPAMARATTKPAEVPVAMVNRDAVTGPEPPIQIEPPPVRNKRMSPRTFKFPPDLHTKTASLLPSNGPVMADPPALRAESPGSVPLLRPALSLSLPAPRAEVPRAASGRIIWTGQLAKHAVLSLSGQGASSGYLNGWIPKEPVHVDVHPAELINGGMVIFTKEGTSSAEPPNPRNGWNTVLYKHDPERASELAVLDSPGPGNDWNQLILQNGDRRLAIVVLDWRSLK